MAHTQRLVPGACCLLRHGQRGDSQHWAEVLEPVEAVVALPGHGTQVGFGPPVEYVPTGHGAQGLLAKPGGHTAAV